MASGTVSEPERGALFQDAFAVHAEAVPAGDLAGNGEAKTGAVGVGG